MSRKASEKKVERIRSMLEIEKIRRTPLALAHKACTAPGGYQAGWVHELICQKLLRFSEDVRRGRSPRLALFMPPRHGKTFLSSICLPAFHMGRNPSHSMMVVSYAAHLATDCSYQTRDILRAPWYQAAFPGCRIRADRGGVATWTTTRGGTYYPLGIDSSISGRGGHVLVIDDLYKNEQEARSASHRDMTWDRYRTTLYTRLAPGGGIFLLQTRWHDDDVPGRIIRRSEDGSGEKWDVICFPAIATENEQHRGVGEALHRDRFPIGVLHDLERELGPLAWASLYQQDPLPEGGEVITRDMIRFYNPLAMEFSPSDQTVISFDLAASRTEHSDRCAGQIWTRKGANVYLRAAVAGVYTFHDICSLIQRMAEVNPGATVLIESRAWGPAAVQWLREKGVPKVTGWDPQRWGSKQQRVSIAASYAAAGNLYVPHSELFSWVNQTLSEWFRFPVAKNDDAVDAMSQAVLWLYRFASHGFSGFIGGAPVKPKPHVW